MRRSCPFPRRRWLEVYQPRAEAIASRAARFMRGARPGATVVFVFEKRCLPLAGEWTPGAIFISFARADRSSEPCHAWFEAPEPLRVRYVQGMAADVTRTAPTSERPLVLIVDDYEDTRDMYAAELESAGYLVEVADDGEKAMLAACADRPALIVMDLGMPNIDGFTAIRAVRALPELDSVYIMVLSALDDDVSRRRAKEAGCDEYLTKPMLPVDLVSRVRRAIESGLADSREAR